MGRKRKSQNEKLPPYVYLSKGRYVFRIYHNGKLGKEIRLCNKQASLSEIWTAYEAVISQERNTLQWLLKEYLKTDSFKELSSLTKRDYERYFEVICSRSMTDGRDFGSIPLSSITPGLIRKYLDKRGKEAPVQANREIAFISSAWNWGRERDMCSENPCIGVRRNKEKPRDRYVTDEEYNLVYELALQTAPPYIPLAMEIAYLCRARLAEILRLKSHHVQEEGLLLERVKKSRSQIITWTPRLKVAVNGLKKLPGVSFQRFLFHNRSNQNINSSTFSQLGNG